MNINSFPLTLGPLYVLNERSFIYGRSVDGPMHRLVRSCRRDGRVPVPVRILRKRRRVRGGAAGRFGAPNRRRPGFLQSAGCYAVPTPHRPSRATLCRPYDQLDVLERGAFHSDFCGQVFRTLKIVQRRQRFAASGLLRAARLPLTRSVSTDHANLAISGHVRGVRRRMHPRR